MPVLLDARAPQNVVSVPESTPLPETWLEGSIGDATIRAYVGEAGYPKTNGLWGIYYDTKTWKPIALEGLWISPGTIRFHESDTVYGRPLDDEKPRPLLELRLTEQGALGTRSSTDAGRTVPVRLRRISQPARFEQAIKTPRRLADRRWPIELIYPAGWFVHVTDSELALRSPDPSDILFEKVLNCVRGRGLPSAPPPGEGPQHFKGHFYRGRDGWLVDPSPGPGLSDCVNDTCSAPTARVIGTATFMTAEVGNRHYGPWGYAGLSDANEYLILDGSEWVHCSDRLLDSPDRIRLRK